MNLNKLGPLNDQNFAVKSVSHNLLRVFCRLIDSLEVFLSSKSSFSVIVLQLLLHVSFYCRICTDFSQVNVRITVVIFPDEHLLDWSSSALLDSPSIIFLLKSLSLKSDHQDLLRNICFQKLYFHCSSAEEWSSSHIFWGAFISSSLNQHCIALHHMFGSFTSHLTKTYYWRYRVMTDS